MGQIQHTPAVKPTPRRSPSRTCLRKGCGHVFRPGRWNQRYCQDPHCLEEVRRWQAAKRQRVFRQSAENRKRQAESEARRRRAKKEAAAAEGLTNHPSQDVNQEPSLMSRRAGAWSRSNEFPEDFCDRPGCYEPLPTDSRAPARYCGGDCRQAMRRVRDRERKWLIRNGDASPTRRRDRASVTRANDPLQKQMRDNPPTGSRIAESPGPSHRVGDYRDGNTQTLSSSPVHDHPSRSFDEDDDSKTDSRCRSRPPPTG